MRMLIKTFACAFAASLALLACSGENSDSRGCKNVSAKRAIDPGFVNINDNYISPAVKKWMDEQLASEGNEIKTIHVADNLYEMFIDEDKGEKWEKTRDLITSGEIINPYGLDGWETWMTAKDIDELVKNYTEFIIDFSSRARDRNGNIISADVQSWMEEQLASGGSEKKEIHISDMQTPQFEMEPVSGGYNSGSYGSEITLNGQQVTMEEYLEYMDNYWREHGEKLEAAKRHLPFEGVSEKTAAELEDILKNYAELAVEFYTEPMPTIPPGGGTGDVSAWEDGQLGGSSTFEPCH